MIEKYVNCNICNSNDYSIIFPAGKAQIHRIVKCRKCDLMYANPQTDNLTGVEEIYKVEEQANNIGDISYIEEDNQYLQKQYLQIKDYAKIIDYVETENKGKFLEVGSFAGVFLNEAKKKGWDVLGIEPLETPALYSEKNFGIKVLREYFEAAEIAPESIDVISSCHVIEHVPDPTEFLKKAYSCLTTGGKLILETPTYDSISFSILRHRERSVRCEGHLYFFTKRTLIKLLEKNGFRTLKHELVGRTLSVERILYNIGVITGRENMFSKLSSNKVLRRTILNLNMRDMQRVYCEKI